MTQFNWLLQDWALRARGHLSQTAICAGLILQDPLAHREDELLVVIGYEVLEQPHCDPSDDAVELAASDARSTACDCILAARPAWCVAHLSNIKN